MSYTAFERLVASYRVRAVLPHMRPRSRVCDIGCGLGARFLYFARAKISFGVGIDDQVSMPAMQGAAIVRGDITQGMPFRSGQFDHAMLLAVLEHLSHPGPLFTEIFRILAPGGSLIMTWPTDVVDPLLHVLRGVRLVSKEMESERHQVRTPLPVLLSMLSEIGFTMCWHQRFELGLNNLLVCYKAHSGDDAVSKCGL